MEEDQQFCLRWNNHQSTLISVFDNLLASETLVDCTLAAEGKYLKAHKVVLSACSPYFANLLKEQYDKHPIFILKDVKYQELRYMMDYMYRGEVNISQDQLPALLKAAESLQIKGLSDNRPSVPNPEQQHQQQHQQHHQQQHQQHHRASLPTNIGPVAGIAPKYPGTNYTLEQTKRARMSGRTMGSIDTSELDSREGSSSPSRKLRKMRRKSNENATNDTHDNSNSSQLLQSNQQQQVANANIVAGLSGVGGISAVASALAASSAAVAVLHTGSSLAAAAVAPTSGGAGGGSSIKKTDSLKATSQTDAMNIIENSTPGGSNLTIVAAGSVANALSDIHHHHQYQTHHTDTTTGGDKIVLKQKLQQQQQPSSKDISANQSELVIEPKSEYDDDANDEAVEDLTLDEEDMGMEDLDQKAGPSQGGEGSSQGYAPWQQDQSQDELLLNTQEAQQRDPQDVIMPICGGLSTSSGVSVGIGINVSGSATSNVSSIPSVRLFKSSFSPIDGNSSIAIASDYVTTVTTCTGIETGTETFSSSVIKFESTRLGENDDNNDDDDNNNNNNNDNNKNNNNDGDNDNDVNNDGNRISRIKIGQKLVPFLSERRKQEHRIDIGDNENNDDNDKDNDDDADDDEDDSQQPCDLRLSSHLKNSLNMVSIVLQQAAVLQQASVDQQTATAAAAAMAAAIGPSGIPTSTTLQQAALHNIAAVAATSHHQQTAPTLHALHHGTSSHHGHHHGLINFPTHSATPTIGGTPTTPPMRRYSSSSVSGSVSGALASLQQVTTMSQALSGSNISNAAAVAAAAAAAVVASASASGSGCVTVSSTTTVMPHTTSIAAGGSSGVTSSVTSIVSDTISFGGTVGGISSTGASASVGGNVSGISGCSGGGSGSGSGTGSGSGSGGVSGASAGVTGSSSAAWGGAYTCHRCGNSYARPHSLNRHVRFECGVEPKFECPICHKKSKHKHNLVLHMRTHQHR